MIWEVSPLDYLLAAGAHHSEQFFTHLDAVRHLVNLWSLLLKTKVLLAQSNDLEAGRGL